VGSAPLARIDVDVLGPDEDVAALLGEDAALGEHQAAVAEDVDVALLQRKDALLVRPDHRLARGIDHVGRRRSAAHQDLADRPDGLNRPRRREDRLRHRQQQAGGGQS
jgi:hypothetical protein